MGGGKLPANDGYGKGLMFFSFFAVRCEVSDGETSGDGGFGWEDGVPYLFASIGAEEQRLGIRRPEA